MLSPVSNSKFHEPWVHKSSINFETDIIENNENMQFSPSDAD